MRKLLFFAIVAAVLLVPCAAVYASNDSPASGNAIDIEAVDDAQGPAIQVFGDAIGGVKSGDIFNVDLSNTPVDTEFILSLVNADEMVHNYRYMTLHVGVYVQNAAGDWEKVTNLGTTSADIYLTMQGGVTSFTLAGNARYKITIDNGCFRSYCAAPGQKVAIPTFYLATG